MTSFRIRNSLYSSEQTKQTKQTEKIKEKKIAKESINPEITGISKQFDVGNDTVVLDPKDGIWKLRAKTSNE